MKNFRLLKLTWNRLSKRNKVLSALFIALLFIILIDWIL